MTSLIEFLKQNSTALSLFGMMALNAMATALPVPGTPLSWAVVYKFFYDWFRSFISIKTGKVPDPSPGAVFPKN